MTEALLHTREGKGGEGKGGREGEGSDGEGMEGVNLLSVDHHIQSVLYHCTSCIAVC